MTVRKFLDKKGNLWYNADTEGSMMTVKSIPISVENFSEIIISDYYYTDKPLLIRDLLDSGRENKHTLPNR